MGLHKTEGNLLIELTSALICARPPPLRLVGRLAPPRDMVSMETLLPRIALWHRKRGNVVYVSSKSSVNYSFFKTRPIKHRATPLWIPADHHGRVHFLLVPPPPDLLSIPACSVSVSAAHREGCPAGQLGYAPTDQQIVCETVGNNRGLRTEPCGTPQPTSQTYSSSTCDLCNTIHRWLLHCTFFKCSFCLQLFFII